MDDDASVRVMVEFFNVLRYKDGEELVERNPSIASYFLEEKFPEKLKDILSWRRTIITKRWFSFIDNCYKKMFSSHKMYMTFIMFACISEQNHHPNIFDSLISVCLLVYSLNRETFLKTGVDFRPLNTDIVMVFYYNELKFIFSKKGGFQQFIEHIRSHRLAKKNCNETPLSLQGSAAAVSSKRMPKKFEKELNKVTAIKITNPEEVSKYQRSIDLANLVLLLPSIELPSLPTYNDLILRLVEYKKRQTSTTASEKEKFKTAERFETLTTDLQGFSSSVSEPKKIKLNTESPTWQKQIDYIDPKSGKRMVEELKIYSACEENSDDIVKVLKKQALSYQQEFATISVQPLNLLNERDEIERPNEFKMGEVVKTYGRVKASAVTSHGSSSSSSDSKTSHDPKNHDNIEQYENIIQAVIKYNHAKSLSNENTKNRILEDADGLLENLNNTIKLFIKVLDKCDNK